MKNRFIIIWLFSLVSNLSFSQSEKKLELEFKRDYLGKSLMIHLKNRGQIKDSLELKPLDFKTDSLIEINDSVWHYFYSFYKRKGTAQIIITELNEKIQLSLAINFQRRHFTYLLDSNFFSGKPVLTQIIDKKEKFFAHTDYDREKNFFVRDTIYNGEYPIALKYDPEKKIYYQQKEVLNGEYDISGIDFTLKGNYFNNEEVPSIKFAISKMIYLKNKWYQINMHPHKDDIIYNLIPHETFFQFFPKIEDESDSIMDALRKEIHAKINNIKPNPVFDSILARDTFDLTLGFDNCLLNNLDFLSPGVFVKQNGYKWDPSLGTWAWKFDTISENEYIKLSQQSDSIRKLSDAAYGKFCRFYDKGGKLVEEGYWGGDAFLREYRKYYANGRLEEAQFFSEKDPNKLKSWKFYSEDGKLIKEKIYNEKGELLREKRGNKNSLKD